MKKFKLNLNELKVNSFEISRQETGKGTIKGNVEYTGHTCIYECTYNIACTNPTDVAVCDTKWRPCY